MRSAGRRSYLVRCQRPDGTTSQWMINTAATFLDDGVKLKERDGNEYRVLGPPYSVPGESLLVIDVKPA